MCLSHIGDIAGGIGKFFGWLRDSELRQDGRNRERLDAIEQEEKDAQKAREIDDQPVPTDRGDILDGM